MPSPLAGEEGLLAAVRRLRHSRSVPWRCLAIASTSEVGEGAWNWMLLAAVVAGLLSQPVINQIPEIIAL